MALVGAFSISTAFADIKLMDEVYARPMAQDFAFPDLNGNVHVLSEYRGQYLMVNFWAIWCKPCRREMPAMNKLSEALEEADFEIVSIHVGPAKPGIDRFLAEVPVDFTILVDENITLSDWDVHGLPTTLLIDPDGRLIYKAVGERRWDAPEMLDFLESIMARTAERSQRRQRMAPSAPKI